MAGALDFGPLFTAATIAKISQFFLAMAFSMEDYLRKNLGFAGRFISEFGETGVTIAMKDIKQ